MRLSVVVQELAAWDRVDGVLELAEVMDAEDSGMYGLGFYPPVLVVLLVIV